jgi:hypothetical protein
MSAGAWLLMFFTLVSLLYLWSWLEPEEKNGFLQPYPSRYRNCASLTTICASGVARHPEIEAVNSSFVQERRFAS